MLKSVNSKNKLCQQYLRTRWVFVGCIFPNTSQRKKYCTSARKTLTGKSVYFKGQKVSEQVRTTKLTKLSFIDFKKYTGSS